MKSALNNNKTIKKQNNFLTFNNLPIFFQFPTAFILGCHSSPPGGNIKIKTNKQTNTQNNEKTKQNTNEKLTTLYVLDVHRE